MENDVSKVASIKRQHIRHARLHFFAAGYRSRSGRLYISALFQILNHRVHWVNANIAKCKVIVPVMDGFRRYAHARVITDFKNMVDYHEERTLKACEKSKTKTRTTATRLQETLKK